MVTQAEDTHQEDSQAEDTRQEVDSPVEVDSPREVQASAVAQEVSHQEAQDSVEVCFQSTIIVEAICDQSE